MSVPPPRDNHRELPIGRRIAQLRARRGMNQQVFADRIGRSKSWVDKVERGVRRLDRLPMIEAVAAALGVTPAVLLGRNTRRAPAAGGTAAAVEAVREALADHDAPAGRDWPPSVTELDRQLRYAETTYRHAHHQQTLRVLPGLLTATRHAHHTAQILTGPLLARVHRLTALTMVKLGDPHLAWLAADRAMTAAAGDPRRAGYAAVALAQALRAIDRPRLALLAATTAVRPLDLAPYRELPADGLALAGTLLTEAAIAAATCGDTTTCAEYADRAHHLAVTHDARGHHDDDGFAPVTVDLARALAAARLGDHATAVALHHRATRDAGWPRLPAEHRAAHLIDMARVHLDTGDHHAAGRALLAADQTAPAEVRLRPAAHTLLTTLVRAGRTPADLTRLAATIGLTRPPRQ
ncbi:helix-turn-helix domain-containing protein [Micromonospora sp. WMMD882]|uniref:helix-turn-helix domain-containing protein n=1 Tax=Micromonospora sp. WMMD882 TaxID=3015151 RepID=UPI00248CD90C|nr:helix-turn-helix domain-containing protein [Micromonospora sp. WMMD882]WBB79859.1 helix-turn-helix domain-containing protein [Micromonospora sp. WMMD882]